MDVVDILSIRRACKDCGLNELCLPRGLSREDLEKLDKILGRTRLLHKGECLFSAGDKFRYLYAVRAGCIKLYIDSDQGEQQILGFYLPGEILGFDGVENKNHSCTAVALETSSLCAFSYAGLTDVCVQLPALNEQIFRFMGRELSQENQLLLTVAKKHADGRIASFLLSLSIRFQKLGYSSSELKLSMSRSEIGNYLGLTFETVSRSLHKLQTQEVIKINHKHIEILDFQILENYCNSPIISPKSGNNAL